MFLSTFQISFKTFSNFYLSNFWCFFSNISFQPSKPSFELSLQLLNFLLKIFQCKILLCNIQPFFFWIVIFLALFQMFILYVCRCDAHLDLWIFFLKCCCSCFFICRENACFQRIGPVSTALRSFLRWITCTLRRLYTVTWRWAEHRLVFILKPYHY